jgi:hypothetical protein
MIDEGVCYFDWHCWVAAVSSVPVVFLVVAGLLANIVAGHAVLAQPQYIWGSRAISSIVAVSLFFKK